MTGPVRPEDVPDSLMDVLNQAEWSAWEELAGDAHAGRKAARAAVAAVLTSARDQISELLIRQATFCESAEVDGSSWRAAAGLVREWPGGTGG